MSEIGDQMWLPTGSFEQSSPDMFNLMHEKKISYFDSSSDPVNK